VIARALFRLARSPLAGTAVRFAFGHAASLLPVRRVHETPTVLAFHHPRPAWPAHVLLVPKRAARGLLELGPAELPLVVDVLEAARAVEAALGLGGQRRVLVVNGGAYQDVGQLHFHLAVGAEELFFACPRGAPPVRLLDDGAVEAVAHPEPGRTTHLLVRAKAPGASLRNPATATALFAAAQRLARGQGLERRGFAVVHCRAADGGPDAPCVHVVSGGRTARRSAP
jgi:histidine triad (HIT) family protein